MTQATQSRARRTIAVLKDTWEELDYAQRRLLELTGIPAPQPQRPKPHATAESWRRSTPTKIRD
ncbi:MAG: hypothetical protein M3018_01265 [Actinomycetota bacterium]|nr:hypothetical protein [Actinomycetota bacterium]